MGAEDGLSGREMVVRKKERKKESAGDKQTLVYIDSGGEYLHGCRESIREFACILRELPSVFLLELGSAVFIRSEEASHTATIVLCMDSLSAHARFIY